jgi:molybdenum cofactor sulfurtransferase
MGNKHSSLTSSNQDRQHRINFVAPGSLPHVEPPPVSHITLKCHRSQASLMKSTSSHETFWSEKHHHADHRDPYSYPSHPVPGVPLPLPPRPAPPSLYAYNPLAPPRSQQDNTARAYEAFLKAFPEYQNTWIIDTLRRTDFSRLDRAGETYVDYMGGAQHPESLVRVHGDFLTHSVMGNTHSVSNR